MIIFIHKNDNRINRNFIIFLYKTNLVKKIMSSEFLIHVLIQGTLKLRNVFWIWSYAS